MKIRKHKNNKWFLITFSTRPASRTETHVDENGKARKVIARDIETPVSRVWRAGSCWQSVRNAFLFGRDQNNVATVIREARPLAWEGRFVCTMNQTDSANPLLPV